ncbi:retrovirus-related pol polyprotein from transposon TNT 1-94 [Tanacetum coccineum]
MKTLFRYQDLWDYVETCYEGNKEDEAHSKEHKKRDAKALFFIQQAVDESIFSRVAGATTAKQAWTTLKTEIMRREFETSSMKNNESVQEFLARAHESRINRSVIKEEEMAFQTKGDVEFSNQYGRRRRGQGGYRGRGRGRNNMIGCSNCNKIGHSEKGESFKRGITRQLTAPYTPEQNDVAERKNRTVVEMARSMLKQKGMPHSFWAEGVATAVHILNLSPTKAVWNQTPYEAWNGNKPSVSLEITQTQEGIFMSQKKYVADTLKKFSMQGCKISATPMNTNEKLRFEDDTGAADVSVYRSLVGRLIYLAHSHPDISYVVGVLSRIMHRPTKHHFRAMKSQESPALFSSSKKQASVTLSSTEAEYVAAAASSCQAVWPRRILKDVGHEQVKPTIIKCDNKSAVLLARNPIYHSRTKHIKIKHHYIRELIANGEIQLEECRSDAQIADVLTKSLPRVKHEELTAQLGISTLE